MGAPITEFVDVNVNLSGVTGDRFSFGTLMLVAPHTVTTNRQDGPYESVQALNDAGFTSGAAAAVNAWGTSVFSQDSGVDKVLIGRQDAGDANLTASLDAIEADDADSWYITNTASRVQADIEEVAAWIEARTKIYIPQSSDSGILDGTAANVALNLQASGYNRTALAYHQTDSTYLDGAWSSVGGGFQLDAPDGVGIWAYQPNTGAFSGVVRSPVSGAQSNEIFSANANLYGRTKGLTFMSKGTMASGRFIDVTTSADWVQIRSEEAMIAEFVSQNKIPYTPSGINLCIAVLQDVLTRGEDAGHFLPGSGRVLTPDFAAIAKQAKIDRELTLQGEAILAGAVQKVIYNLTISF